MNPTIEVERLLKESGAVLIRRKKHLVYRLPSGQNIVMAKTSSDPERAAKNNLKNIRHVLGIDREAIPKHKGESDMPVQQTAVPVVATPQEQAAPVVAPQQGSLKQAIEAAIVREEATQEKLLSEAQAVERRLQMLKGLLPFADDPNIEGALRAVLPAIEPPTPYPPPPAPEPPQQITERVQVTRQLVFAATQTFDGTFTVNDVLGLMMGGRQIDPPERLRIRSSVAQAMTTLHERGELIRVAEGYGKRQATWSKVVPVPNGSNGHGNGSPAGTRA